MPLPLSSYSILVCFAQRTRIPTSARSIGFCVIWVCISSSSIMTIELELEIRGSRNLGRKQKTSNSLHAASPYLRLTTPRCRRLKAPAQFRFERSRKPINLSPQSSVRNLYCALNRAVNPALKARGDSLQIRSLCFEQPTWQHRHRVTYPS